MSKKIEIASLSNAVRKMLETYSDEAIKVMNEAVDEAGKAGLEELKVSASGKFNNADNYAKTWRVRKIEKSVLKRKDILHTPTDYRIAHLLEHGHVKRGGGRTRDFPHVAPAEKKAEQVLVEELEKKLGGKS